MKYIQLTQNYVAFVDDEDYERVNTQKWRALRKGTNCWSVITGKWTVTPLANFIMGDPPTGFIWDHVNRNDFDNQRSNLRLATTSQNGMNRTMNYNNTSGYPGVRYYKSRDRWKADIGANGERIYLGFFKTKEEAIRARKVAELTYFGDFAPKV